LVNRCGRLGYSLQYYAGLLAQFGCSP
jgi:hypothetical protein